jgi:hypothetical protein
MEINVYCDESQVDLFVAETPAAKFALIGSLWLPKGKAAEVKGKIAALKAKHNAHHELKWSKVSAAKSDFYKDLIDLFIDQGESLRFRCIAVEASKLDMKTYHDGDQELGFYKFYYQLIAHWIRDLNQYSIFCDHKTNRMRDRLAVLRRCLNKANLMAMIKQVQALPSQEVALIQLVDFLLGAVGSELNATATENKTKMAIIKHLKRGLKINNFAKTPKAERKFNIFVIRLDERNW